MAQGGGLPLQLFLAQDGADEQPVTLAYDQAAGAYVGSLPCDAKRAAEFSMRFVGVDGKGSPSRPRPGSTAPAFIPAVRTSRSFSRRTVT